MIIYTPDIYTKLANREHVTLCIIMQKQVIIESRGLYKDHGRIEHFSYTIAQTTRLYTRIISHSCSQLYKESIYLRQIR